jgi:hypothetical protein
MVQANSHANCYSCTRKREPGGGKVGVHHPYYHHAHATPHYMFQGWGYHHSETSKI